MLEIDSEGCRQDKDHEYQSRYGPKVILAGWKLYCERLEKKCTCP